MINLLKIELHHVIDKLADVYVNLYSCERNYENMSWIEIILKHILFIYVPYNFTS